MKILLDSGAQIDARDNDGWTALMSAAFGNENPEVLKILLDAGADAKLRNRAGKTAWDYIQGNDALKGTDVYWRLNDLRF